MNTEWLDNYEEETAIGPVQRDEALFLFSLARVLRPQSVLEFGTGHCHSTRAWLEAGVPSVVTVDINATPELSALKERHGNRLQALTGDMMEFDPAGQVFDVVFFDALHHLLSNMVTFLKFSPSPRVVVVHDTGAWAAGHMLPVHRDFPGVDTPAGKVHQPEEVKFCRWLREYQQYQAVDFHSMNTLRHGLTILQK